MTTTVRPTRSRPAEAKPSLTTVKGQITALEHQRDDLLREIAELDEKQRGALTEADKAERALADGNGKPEAVSSAQTRAKAFGRKAGELRAQLPPIEAAIAPKRATIARENELQQLADTMKRAADLWPEIERREAKCVAAFEQTLTPVVEAKRAFAALQEGFNGAIHAYMRQYNVQDVDALVAELERRGACSIKPIVARHAFTSITGLSEHGILMPHRVDYLKPAPLGATGELIRQYR
jgi:chromosome segregation ATPase